MVGHIYLPDNPRLDFNKAHKKRDFLKHAYVKISMTLYHARSKDKQMLHDLYN